MLHEKLIPKRILYSDAEDDNKKIYDASNVLRGFMLNAQNS